MWVGMRVLGTMMVLTGEGRAQGQDEGGAHQELQVAVGHQRYHGRHGFAGE
jgi:hypothetical protein